VLKKMCTYFKKKNKGFTLIELIIVIGILAILAALAIPAVAGYLDNSKARTNVSNAKLVYNAGQSYLAANPDKAASDIDGAVDATTHPLMDEAYLQNIPHTAGNGDYTLVDTSGVLSVTWPSDTTLPAEDPAGTGAATVGATLTYPAP